MAGLQNGPVPSKLVLLSDLQTCSPGDKVRFLGCVTEYSTKTAILTLEHNHPPGNELKALVDVSLLLNTLKSTDTSFGEWVNVIGYVAGPCPSNSAKRSVPVQALVLWFSGPLKLDRYEKSMDDRKFYFSMNAKPLEPR